MSALRLALAASIRPEHKGRAITTECACRGVGHDWSARLDGSRFVGFGITEADAIADLKRRAAKVRPRQSTQRPGTAPLSRLA